MSRVMIYTNGVDTFLVRRSYGKFVQEFFNPITLEVQVVPNLSLDEIEFEIKGFTFIDSFDPDDEPEKVEPPRERSLTYLQWLIAQRGKARWEMDRNKEAYNRNNKAGIQDSEVTNGVYSLEARWSAWCTAVEVYKLYLKKGKV